MSMTLEQILNVAACIVLIVFGVYSIWQPRPAAKFAHLTPDNANGLTEVRVAFGGLSVMMGLSPLLLNQTVAYQTVGVIFLGVFATRLLATVLDRPQLTQAFLISGAFEVIVGLILLLT